MECPELPISSTITVRAGWIIDEIDVDGYSVGGKGGGPVVYKLGLGEKVTAVEYGYQGGTFWPTGTMCKLTIHTNFAEYGPLAYKRGCQNVKTVQIPSNISFQKFMKENAEAISDKSWAGTAVTIHRN